MINWGIIGLGRVSNEFALGFDGLTNANLLGAASKTAKRLIEFKKKFNINEKYCFSNYEDLIACEEIDIIYIALPHNFHFQWIIKCLEKGKKVLTEKPATSSLNDIKKINEILNNKKIFFAEGFMYRYHPQTKKIISLIENNEIGDLMSMESTFGINLIEKRNIFGFKKIKFNKESRLFNKSLAGGCILDLGCYPTSLSILIAKLKDPNNMEVELKNSKIEYSSTDVDIDSYTNLHFSNGLISSIGCSFKKDLGKSTKIIGTRGSIVVDDSWHCLPMKIKVNDKVILGDKLKFSNIFSYEIESISNSIENKKNEPDYPGISRHDTEKNILILENWRNHSIK
tara:strand:+ start:133 stop:1155 length:1023 start_codon:yes stop_codon:yes gene_type:complete